METPNFLLLFIFALCPELVNYQCAKGLQFIDLHPSLHVFTISCIVAGQVTQLLGGTM